MECRQGFTDFPTVCMIEVFKWRRCRLTLWTILCALACTRGERGGILLGDAVDLALKAILDRNPSTRSKDSSKPEDRERQNKEAVLVLLDYHVPGMNGDVVAAHMKACQRVA
jgi:hypothetical protein